MPHNKVDDIEKLFTSVKERPGALPMIVILWLALAVYSAASYIVLNSGMYGTAILEGLPLSLSLIVLFSSLFYFRAYFILMFLPMSTLKKMARERRGKLKQELKELCVYDRDSVKQIICRLELSSPRLLSPSSLNTMYFFTIINDMRAIYVELADNERK